MTGARLRYGVEHGARDLSDDEIAACRAALERGQSGENGPEDLGAPEPNPRAAERRSR